MIQEFFIQSNIPLLVLVVTIGCIIILGYLEHRNIMERLDIMEHHFDALTQRVKKDIQLLEEKTKDVSNHVETPSNEESSVKDDVKDDVKVVEKATEKVTDKVADKVADKDVKVAKELPPPSMLPVDPVQAMFSSMMGGTQSIMMDVSTKEPFEGFKFEEPTIDEIDEKEIKKDPIEEDFMNLTKKTEEGDKVIKDIKNIEDPQKEEEEEEDYESYSDSYSESEYDEDEKKDDKQVKGISIHDGLSVNDLKKLCKDNNLPVTGNKSQLIERINKLQK